MSKMKCTSFNSLGSWSILISYIVILYNYKESSIIHGKGLTNTSMDQRLCLYMQTTKRQNQQILINL